MAKDVSRARPSAHQPLVRGDLCRYLRSKGMIVNIDEEDPNAASFQARYLGADPNALPFETTIWWCEHTSKVLGPDDRPCDRDRCVKGRDCWEP